MIQAIQVTCVSCGWVHLGFTPKVCQSNVDNFNAYYETLDQEQQAHYGGPAELLRDYGFCKSCKKESKVGQFRLAVKTEFPVGIKIDSVFVENLEDLLNEENMYASG